MGSLVFLGTGRRPQAIFKKIKYNGEMCFSATASFAAATALTPAGIYGIRRALKFCPKYLIVTLTVIAFTIQQVIEGFMWLSIGSSANGSDELVITLAKSFLFFSHFYWPIAMPLTAFIIEQNKTKKKIYLIATIAGTIFASLLYFPLLMGEGKVLVQVVQNSIQYDMDIFYDSFVSRKITGVIYALFIVAPLLTSSDKHMKHFGWVITLAGLPTYFFYYHAYTSVWCFFAAIASIYITYIIFKETHKG